MNKAILIRIFKRNRLFILLLATILINYLNFLNVNNEQTFVNFVPLQSAWNMNMMITGESTIGGMLYMFLSFLMASLPLSDILVEDRKSGLRNQILLRVSKSNYYKNIYFYNFLFGGLFLIFPLIINLMLWMMVRPLFAMNYMSASLINQAFLADLFVKSPYMFFIVHLFLVFLTGGIISSLSLIINDKFNSFYVGGIVILILDVIASIINQIYVFQTKNYTVSFLGLKELVINRVLPDNIINWIYILILFILPIVYLKIKSKEEIVWTYLLEILNIK